MRIPNGTATSTTLLIRTVPLTVLADARIAVLLNGRLGLELASTQCAGTELSCDARIFVLNRPFRTEAALVAFAFRWSSGCQP